MQRYAERYPGCRFVGFWRKYKYEEDYFSSSVILRARELEDIEDDFNVDCLPWPADLVDEAQSPVILEKLAEYLDKCPNKEKYCGYSRCRICKEHVGSKDKGDGTWVWPEGLSHYVREHKVKLPDDFIRWVIYGVQEQES